jgi:ComF family protein
VKFKYGGALDAGKTLAQIIVEVFRRNYRSGDIDLIVPMPIHRNRLVERGFSQTLLLAGAISRESSIPVDHSSFCKLKDTPAQAGLSRDERVRNLKGSFHVRRPDRIRGRRVLLIDDVATTGSTIREASAALVSASPASLQVLALAFRKWSDAPDESQSLVQSGVL